MRSTGGRATPLRGQDPLARAPAFLAAAPPPLPPPQLQQPQQQPRGAAPSGRQQSPLRSIRAVRIGADDLRSSAGAKWLRGDRAGAADLYKAVLEQRPNDAEALCRIAVAAFLEQASPRVAEASELLVAAAAQPDPPQDAVAWLGYTLLLAGDAAKAIATLRVATLHPEKTMQAEVHLYWALAAMELGDEAGAAVLFVEAARGHAVVYRILSSRSKRGTCPDAELLRLLAPDLPGAGPRLYQHLAALVSEGPTREHLEALCSGLPGSTLSSTTASSDSQGLSPMPSPRRSKTPPPPNTPRLLLEEPVGCPVLSLPPLSSTPLGQLAPGEFASSLPGPSFVRRPM